VSVCGEWYFLWKPSPTTSFHTYLWALVSGEPSLFSNEGVFTWAVDWYSYFPSGRQCFGSLYWLLFGKSRLSSHSVLLFSQAVSHSSANQAWLCLVSEIRWNQTHSGHRLFCFSLGPWIQTRVPGQIESTTIDQPYSYFSPMPALCRCTWLWVPLILQRTGPIVGVLGYWLLLLVFFHWSGFSLFQFSSIFSVSRSLFVLFWDRVYIAWNSLCNLG
jgi:hypothetical protein